MKLFFLFFLILGGCQTHRGISKNWSCTESSPDIDLKKIRGKIGASAKGLEKAGTCYYYAGKLNLAQIFYEKSLQKKTISFESLLGMARVSDGQGKVKKTLEYYNKLKEYYSGNPQFWRFYLAYTFFYYDFKWAKTGIKYLKSSAYVDLASFYEEVVDFLRGKKKTVNLSEKLIKKYPDSGIFFSYIAYLKGDKILGRKILEKSRKFLSEPRYKELLSFWENRL